MRLSDPQTRTAFGLYFARCAALMVFGFTILLVAALPMSSDGADGGPKPGVPVALYNAMMLGGIFLAPAGLVCSLNCVRMAWVLVRHPWAPVASSYDEVGKGFFSGAFPVPNGQPVLSITQGDAQRRLTMAAFKWRWRRFRQPELLFAGRSKGGGVIATADRRSLVWAGRSLLTAWMTSD